ncbi:MAG: hypothetical protein ACI841_003333 [Planctomycetota bacterium]|jgi:hypothetical protein
MTAASCTPTRPDGSRPWSKHDWWALIALAVLSLGALPFLVHSWYEPVNDASLYLLTAKAIAAGDGYSYLGEPFYLRAPGLSALIAPFVSGEEIQFFAIHMLVSLFGVACVLLLFVYNRERLGWALSLGCSLVVWALPGFQQLGNQVMSDLPGAALLLACLLTERWSARSPAMKRELVLGLAIGASTYIRSALVLLLPAIIVSRLLQYFIERRRAAHVASFSIKSVTVFAFTAIVVMLPWSVRNALLEDGGPRYQTVQYSQSALLLRENVNDPDSPLVGAGEFLSRMPERAGEAILGMGSMRMVKGKPLSSESLGTARVAWGAFLFIAVLIAFVRRREPAEIFIGGTMLVLLVFPSSFLERYTFPIFLFALPSVVDILRGSIRRCGGERISQVGTFVGLIVLAAMVFDPRHGWELAEGRHRHWQKIGEEVEKRLPADALPVSARGWHLSVYMGRPVYSFGPAIRQLGEENGFKHITEKYGVNTVLITEGDKASANGLRYCRQRRFPASMIPGFAVTLWIIRLSP